MPNPKHGSIRKRDGKWYARISYKGSDGKRYYIERLAKNKTHAGELLGILKAELDVRAGLTQTKMTVGELCEFYRTHYVSAPIYQKDRKVSGLRGHKEQNRLLNLWKELIGNKKIRELKPIDIEILRKERLLTPTKDKRERSIATVNRELALLRRILTVATQQGWLIKNPFQASRAISTADETHRDRIISPDEETRLLEACNGPRAHLRPIVIFALDTGFRKGEILKLKWEDIDFNSGRVVVQALNSKTLKSRAVQMTARLERELKNWRDISKAKPADLVFDLCDFKRAWATACKIAELSDLRFHDCRHTAATRLVQGGLSLAEVGRILGHSSPITTYRYITGDTRTAVRAAAILDEFGKQ